MVGFGLIPKPETRNAKSETRMRCLQSVTLKHFFHRVAKDGFGPWISDFGLIGWQPAAVAVNGFPHVLRIVFSNFDDLANPWYAGGGARAIHEVTRRLAARHEVAVLTGNFPGARQGLVDGVEYRRLGAAWAGPRLGQLIYSTLLPLAVRRTPHEVWVESLTPPFSTGMLPWFTRRPVAALTQILGGAGMTKKYGLPFDRVERSGLRHYRHAIALSEVIKAQLLGMNPRLNVAVIPNGVPDELIARTPQRAERHVLFLGRIDREQKGLDLLLDAWARVPRPAVPLVIAGTGPATELAWLRSTCASCPNEVRLVGRVEGAEKLRLMDEALFLVMPSRFEGFPLTMVEAFCHELPVVLYAIPELAWLPASCSVKLPPFDVSALADALHDLLADSERRRRMGGAARQEARAYGWDALAGRYEKFLAGLVAGG